MDFKHSKIILAFIFGYFVGYCLKQRGYDKQLLEGLDNEEDDHSIPGWVSWAVVAVVVVVVVFFLVYTTDNKYWRKLSRDFFKPNRAKGEFGIVL